MQQRATWLAGLALFLPTVALADCPSTLATLDEDVAVAVDAMSARTPEGALSPDMTAFGAAHTSAGVHLDCLSEPLTPAAAAAWHRLGGLAASQAGDGDAALLHFRAATSADKSFLLPMTLAPRGSDLRGVYSAALTQPAAQTADIEVPEGHQLVIDGTPGAARPVGLPTVMQLLDGEGSVLGTWHVEADADPPTWPIAEPEAETESAVAEAESETEPEAEPETEAESETDPAGADTDPWEPLVDPQDGVVEAPVVDPWGTGDASVEPVVLPDPPREPDGSVVNLPLLGAAGATAVAGGVLYGLALGVEGQFKDTSVSRDDAELDAMRSRANNLGYAGQGLGIAALGLAGLSFAVSF